METDWTKSLPPDEAQARPPQLLKYDSVANRKGPLCAARASTAALQAKAEST
jgi:hypothetical protein